MSLANDATPSEIINGALLSAAQALDACQNPHDYEGPALFVREMADFWRFFERMEGWGSPAQIDRLLSQYAGVYPTMPEPVAGFQAASHHELGLGLAGRVLIIVVNALTAAEFLERGVTVEALSASGLSILIHDNAYRGKTKMFRDWARSDRKERFGVELTRNWGRVRATILSMGPNPKDLVTLAARVRDEAARVAKTQQVPMPPAAPQEQGEAKAAAGSTLTKTGIDGGTGGAGSTPQEPKAKGENLMHTLPVGPFGRSVDGARHAALACLKHVGLLSKAVLCFGRLTQEVERAAYRKVFTAAHDAELNAASALTPAYRDAVARENSGGPYTLGPMSDYIAHGVAFFALARLCRESEQAVLDQAARLPDNERQVVVAQDDFRRLLAAFIDWLQQRNPVEVRSMAIPGTESKLSPEEIHQRMLATGRVIYDARQRPFLLGPVSDVSPVPVCGFQVAAQEIEAVQIGIERESARMRSLRASSAGSAPPVPKVPKAGEGEAKAAAGSTPPADPQTKREIVGNDSAEKQQRRGTLRRIAAELKALSDYPPGVSLAPAVYGKTAGNMVRQANALRAFDRSDAAFDRLRALLRMQEVNYGSFDGRNGPCPDIGSHFPHN
jgi:hypothetical protein